MNLPQTAAEVFDTTFLDIRCKLIELAASLDRIERADAPEEVHNDFRLAQIRESIEILSSQGFNRSERIQLVFSDEYEPGWNK